MGLYAVFGTVTVLDEPSNNLSNYEFFYGVFSSEEKANIIVKKLEESKKESYNEHYNIVTCNVDVPTVWFTITTKERW